MGARTGGVLRNLLQRRTLLEQPVVCDPLSARLAKSAGYEAVRLPVQAIGAHLPLGSVLSAEQIEGATQAVIRACGVPVLLSGEIAPGGTAELHRAIVQLEAAGAAAIEVTNWYVADRVPASRGDKRHVDDAEMLTRVRAASAARTDALVVARCDVNDYEHSVDHARALLAAGADALLVHAADHELRKLAADLREAILIYAGRPGPPHTMGAPQMSPSARLLRHWGYNAVSLQYHRCHCPRLTTATQHGTPGRVAPQRILDANSRQATVDQL